MKKRYYVNTAERTITAHEFHYEAVSSNGYTTFEEAKTALLNHLKEEHRIYVEAIEAFAEEVKQAKNSYAAFEEAKTVLLNRLKQEHRIYSEAIEAFTKETKQAKIALADLEARIHQVNVSDESDWITGKL
jgi:hypothetical protein